MMENAEIEDDYCIGVGECSDGEIIYIQGELSGEVVSEIMTTRDNAIELAFLILELTGYEKK